MKASLPDACQEPSIKHANFKPWPWPRTAPMPIRIASNDAWRRTGAFRVSPGSGLPPAPSFPATACLSLAGIGVYQPIRSLVPESLPHVRAFPLRRTRIATGPLPRPPSRLERSRALPPGRMSPPDAPGRPPVRVLRRTRTATCQFCIGRVQSPRFRARKIPFQEIVHQPWRSTRSRKKK